MHWADAILPLGHGVAVVANVPGGAYRGAKPESRLQPMRARVDGGCGHLAMYDSPRLLYLHESLFTFRFLPCHFPFMPMAADRLFIARIAR